MAGFQDRLNAAMAELKKLHAEGVAALNRAPDTRMRGQLHAKVWAIRQMLEQDRRYFSQAGQDAWLDQTVFKGKRNGVFIDIGAFDGISGSNTLFFEAFRGWTGLLIEPSPDRRARLAETRSGPRLHVALGRQAGTAEFFNVAAGYTQMSGLVETLDPKAKQAIDADPRTKSSVIPVPVRPLAEVLSEGGYRVIDYISLDVEGGEEEILAEFPFADFDITAWTVEVRGEQTPARKILEGAGYRMATHLGEDQVFVRND